MKLLLAMIIMTAGCVGTGASASCDDRHGGCDEHAACHGAGDAPTCTCLPGFRGDGVVCVDIDECATDNGGCDVNAVCENGDGFHTCTCKAPFTGDGVTCQADQPSGSR